MKKRIRITPEEAQAMGIKPKPVEKGRRTFRTYLTSDQRTQLKEHTDLS